MEATIWFTSLPSALPFTFGMRSFIILPLSLPVGSVIPRSIFMFAPEEKSTKTSAGVYTPGVYTSTIALGDNTLDVAVSVDADHITSVSLNHLSDSVSAMYPLLEPSLEEINAQLENISSIDDLKLNSENKYTGLILQQAIKNALSKAKS